jgi:hypothetical protein
MPVALEFDLIKAIVEHGSRSEPNETVDPSLSPALRNAGVALVTTYIEQLSLLEIVRDASPLFGAEGGMWIGYRLSDKGRQLAISERDLRHAVGELTVDQRLRFRRLSHPCCRSAMGHRSTKSTAMTF